MTASITASGWTANNDGGGVGLSFTTPAGITTQKLLVGFGTSSNGDTFGVPGTGTWAEVTLPDNVVTSSGGQYRLYQCLNPASSTVYTFSASATRRTLVWMLIDSTDTTGGTMVDVASSLESAAAATHAPPSVTPTASAELVVDLMWFRQFNPDVSTGSPPATGLTWTELLDVRGLDAGGSGQNIQCNVNYATAGSSGVAVSTAALNTDDPFEPALVMRVLIKSAAGGGTPVTLNDTSGGGSASGAPEQVLQGVVRGDTSGGATAGGSPDRALAGVVLTDTSGGSSTGSVGDTVVRGVALQDTSGGAVLGGSPDGVAAGVVLGDVSGGAGAGGAADFVAVAVTVQDGSGGGTAAGTVDGVSVGDTSGGAGAGSSGSQAPTVGVTLPDTSGGAGAGSSADVVASGVVLGDRSGGATAGGSPDTSGAAVIFQDSSGGAGASGSLDGLGVGVVLGGGSGGAGAGDSPGAVLVGKVVQDTSGGAAAAPSPGLVDVPADVTLQDVSGGAGAGSSPEASETPTPTVVQDTMVMPVLLSALACLQDEAAKVPKPPALFTIRPGDAFEPSADPWTDECCVGVGWVRMVSSYETYDFPAPASVMEGNCPPHSWAVVIEVGLNRCVPVAADRRGSIVTSEQWLAAATAQADDGAALRRVLCCLRELYDVADVTAGQVNPLPLQGNCGGVVLSITVRRDACDCYALGAH